MNIFSAPYHNWQSWEVQRIRLALGKSQSEFADMFLVSLDTVKSWEANEGTARHREVCGPEGRLMWAAAEMAQGRTVNLIRLAASGELGKLISPAVWATGQKVNGAQPITQQGGL